MMTSDLIVRHRGTPKFLFVGALSLIMLIPLSLLLAIAVLMYLIRRVDWYGYGGPRPAPSERTEAPGQHE